MSVRSQRRPVFAADLRFRALTSHGVVRRPLRFASLRDAYLGSGNSPNVSDLIAHVQDRPLLVIQTRTIELHTGQVKGSIQGDAKRIRPCTQVPRWNTGHRTIFIRHQSPPIGLKTARWYHRGIILTGEALSTLSASDQSPLTPREFTLITRVFQLCTVDMFTVMTAGGHPHGLTAPLPDKKPWVRASRPIPVEHTGPQRRCPCRLLVL